jgi:hypothetical protein
MRNCAIANKAEPHVRFGPGIEGATTQQECLLLEQEFQRELDYAWRQCSLHGVEGW